MKFYDDKTIDDKIIEGIKLYNYCYEVKYLNNDNTILKNLTENNLENDRIEMLRQAMERDLELYNSYKKNVIRDLLAFSFSSLSFVFSTSGKSQLLFCLLFTISIYFGNTLVSDLKKYIELKKYHIFLEIKDELKKKENNDILNVIEFDKLYQDPKGIVIDNLDNYSIFDIKIIKKELKRRSSFNS